MLDQNKTPQELLEQNVISNLIVGDQEYDINSKYWGKYEPSDIKTINGESIFKDGSGDSDIETPIIFGESENSAVLRGGNNVASSDYSSAFGFETNASGNASHTEGYRTHASGGTSHAEGYETDASGASSHAEGMGTEATGLSSHAEGYYTDAKADYAHSEGQETRALSFAAHAEGYNTEAKKYAHAEGHETFANGESSHAEGLYSEANGIVSHAEGRKTLANGECSHSEGRETEANGKYSHVEGFTTITYNEAEHASGKYNNSVEKTESNTTADATLFSIGVGDSKKKRKNAFEVKQNGDIYIKGLGGYDGNNSESSSNLVKVITDLDEVMNQKISKLIDNAPETYDTLKEIADYIASDKDHAQSVLLQLKTLDTKIETKVKTSEVIQVAGGPLANDILDTDYWPEMWYETPGDTKTVRIIPANTSFDDIIRTLFLKELEGDVRWDAPSWRPSVSQPTVTLSSSGNLEAGTKITIVQTTAGKVSGNTRSASCTSKYGYFLADAEGNPTGSHNANTTLTISQSGESDNTVSYTYTWNGVVVNAGDEMQVKDNSNTLKVSQSGPTVSVDALPTTKVFASTNTKRPMTKVHATLTDTKPSDKKLSNSKDYTITGVRYAFTGAVASGFVANSANVRNLTKNGTSKSALTKMTASKGNTQVIIAFPKSWGSLEKVIDNRALGAVITNSFILTDDVKVDGANGYTPVDYNVYVYTSDVSLNEIDYTISIK